MNNKFETMINLVQDYLRISREMSYITEEYKREIHNKIQEIRCCKENAIDVINRLFKIQEELAILKYKFDCKFDHFLNVFIYEFDRQDEESIDYLVNRIINDNKFLYEEIE